VSIRTIRLAMDRSSSKHHWMFNSTPP
jgi:hypothetical protein